jgi:hypothetical protein
MIGLDNRRVFYPEATEVADRPVIRAPLAFACSRKPG